MIETIEFVLGTISNTASYLRLWALSLAHSELATTFNNMLLMPAWKGKDSIGGILFPTFIKWFIYMGVTWGILLGMDALECSLHTLRLHWVEFQNKHYKGTGYLYVPFSL